MCVSKIGAVYLAAGNSKRFGSNKLLYTIDKKPMFLHGLEIWKKRFRKRFCRKW